ncbi:hypothetical protein H6S82_21405 [Planktothrix sp. FACHB-1355]|uniref:Uncharacterized protein n=1 Tax=Aerosakkonema funiforme FACHB-1375 TaxID=2949571 RepID=A0A926ZFZ6_9CYAN|nr:MULTISPECIES: hypothetical protein [Oscillatoriales]MBD2181643.1 hypothetical protein [Aerosakkonema funiforme FACHB-1375]MBD3561377.1 hypothetical protein [Planktothrix sp. FACHB-1355]
MRKVAESKNHPEIEQVILYEPELDEGVYAFPRTSLNDGFAIGDIFYQNWQDAEESCEQEYGISKDDWKVIPDPLPNCQQDWIAPVRVIGRNTGTPQWGKLEKLIDGKWVEIELLDGMWAEKNISL